MTGTLLVLSVVLSLSPQVKTVAQTAGTPTIQVSPETTSTPSGTRPNIIMIMTDDQTVESMRVMPKVKALLADGGITFSNSYVSYPLCCPSRATYLTGQYTHNNGVWANLPVREGFQQFENQQTTFPVALQDAGYHTAHIGKYLNGYGRDDPTLIPPGWNEWHGSIDPFTYRYYGFHLNNNGVVRNYPATQEYYSTDYFTSLAVDFIKRQATSTQPFFLNLALLAPHSGAGPKDVPGVDAPPPGMSQPHGCYFWQTVTKGGTPAHKHICRRPVTDGYAVPAPQYADTFRDVSLPRPPSFNERKFGDKPRFMRTSGDWPRFNPVEIQIIKRMYQDRLESLLSVDDAVQRIVQTLTDAGILNNTVIIYTTDHGFFLGEHRIPFGKYWPYEEALRTPLIIRGPGIPAGEVRSSPVVNVDLAPTILDLARAHSLRLVDGRSLVPLMKDPTMVWQRDFLLEGKTGNAVPYEGVHTGRYVYIEYRTGDRELYDLQKDPHELNNLAHWPSKQSLVENLHERLLQLEQCAGPSCQDITIEHRKAGALSAR